MKKLISLVAIAAFTLSVTAQEKTGMKHHEPGIHKNFNKNKEQNRSFRNEAMKGITLSEAQKIQLKATHTEYRSKLEVLDKQDNITVGELKAKKEMLRNEQKEKRDQIFTPEQKKQIEINKAEIRANRNLNREKKANQMHVKLGLSNEQVSMLKKQQETTHAQIKAVKENKTLSSDEKKHQVRLLKENFKETRKNILTPEQLKKLDDMKRGKRNMESNKARK